MSVSCQPPDTASQINVRCGRGGGVIGGWPLGVTEQVAPQPRRPVSLSRLEGNRMDHLMIGPDWGLID